MDIRNKIPGLMTIIFIASIIALWALWENIYRDFPREARYTKETAMDLVPPLDVMTLDENLPLLDNFSSIFAKITERVSPKTMALPFVQNKLLFKNDELQINFELRQFFDRLLLLHPEIGLHGVRYLLAKDVEKNIDNHKAAHYRFKQVDRIFCSYVNLLRGLESLPENPSDNNVFETHFSQIMTLRRQYLGETTAQIFFSKEEEKMLKHIRAIKEIK